MLKFAPPLLCFSLIFGALVGQEQPLVSLESDVDLQEEIDSLKGQILNAMRTGQLKKSIDLYRDLKQQTQSEDYELLRLMGQLLLQQGGRTNDPEQQIMAVFGAGLSQHADFLTLFESGLSSTHPQLQLACIHMLASYGDDRADKILKKAFSSPYLPVRLEAAYALAMKKHPMAFGQIESLMYKVPIEFKSIFPQLFAIEGSALSMSVLKQMLFDRDASVRLETVLHLALRDRDDFLPQMRSMLKHVDLIQQEACAFALGQLRDSSSIPELQRLTKNADPHVALAARYALYRLGNQEEAAMIEKEAKEQHSLFAISLLAEIEESEDLLAQLTRVKDRQVRLNATLALLKRRDSRCAPGIIELLTSHLQEEGLTIMHSPAFSLMAWKSTPTVKNVYEMEISMLLKEQILTQCLDLPGCTFLEIAKKLIFANIRQLIPMVTELLINSPSDEGIELLKSQIHRPGTPLIRGYCLLALYRLKPNDSYLAALLETIQDLKSAVLIRFRPLIPRQAPPAMPSNYLLTPEEQSRLFINALLAVTSQKEEVAIDTILTLIVDGNPQNRLALAGLLIRAAE